MCSVFLELIEKLETNESNDFYLFKILRAHILPLTNCAFNKSGDKYGLVWLYCVGNRRQSKHTHTWTDVGFLLLQPGRFITGSYDRTCKVWDTQSGDELLTLEGHKNVVYAIAFNNPYG